MSKELKIVFMGTPEFAAKHLEALLKANKKVVGVVTQPDKPSGRGRKVLPPPVKLVAEKNKIPFIQPKKLANNAEVENWLQNVKPDILVVTAYGLILPPAILNSTPLGAWNIHASLLPKYRGAAPIQWAIMNGEKETGITLMQMDTGLDTGDILIQKAVEIQEEETAGELMEKLIEVGIQVLLRGIELLEKGENLPRITQDEACASYAPPLKKEDFTINWTDSAINIHNKIRGLSPKPGARVGELKIIRSKLQPDEEASVPPGTIVRIGKDGISVATGKRTLLVTQVQPPGGRLMRASDYAHGRHLKVGEPIYN